MAIQRTCMALDLQDDPELIATYEHYHQPEHIWREIPAGIREAGVVDMQIYRIGTRLFMIVDCEEGTDLKTAFEKMGTLPRQAEWAAYMAGFQVKLAEALPGEHWATMKPVFLLNDHLK
ncbi:L-rhamnose mutarotase [Dyadobacter aurulentus]|uniref:L-rhamnose mutarotase n=1 Tax=Dyadobacter sp. UC 10 TaxID=2605428 RepID=UPI0011F15507|nr:L-rhamnose mutarotase [Dyadobacter sp. UC 10]KAA0992103.1 L-rhamnose mutarotase [Dyadobacter sp. UC 10]